MRSASQRPEEQETAQTPDIRVGVLTGPELGRLLREGRGLALVEGWPPSSGRFEPAHFPKGRG